MAPQTSQPVTEILRGWTVPRASRWATTQQAETPGT